MNKLWSKLTSTAADERTTAKSEQSANADNRREYERFDVNVPVVIEAEGDVYEGVLRDVAAGGAFLAPKIDVPEGRKLIITIPNTKIYATAGVRRLVHDGVGVSFDDETVGAIVAGWSKGISD